MHTDFGKFYVSTTEMCQSIIQGSNPSETWLKIDMHLYK